MNRSARPPRPLEDAIESDDRTDNFPSIPLPRRQHSQHTAGRTQGRPWLFVGSLVAGAVFTQVGATIDGLSGLIGACEELDAAADWG
jgi:hypothetical protein